MSSPLAQPGPPARRSPPAGSTGPARRSGPSLTVRTASDRLSVEHQRQVGLVSGTVSAAVVNTALGADPAAISTWFLNVAQGLLAQIQAGYARNRNATLAYLTRHAALNNAAIIPVAGSLDVAALAKRLEIVGPVGFKTAIAAGQDTDEALRHMATNMGGVADEAVRNGDRDVIVQTATRGRGVVGWRRHLSGHACGFCAMLASRGSVYVSRRTATVPKNGDAFHPHCRCWAEPLYDRQAEPAYVRDLQAQWQRVTAGHGGADAMRVWRRHWEQLATPQAQARYSIPRPSTAPAGPGVAVPVRASLAAAQSPDAVAAVFAQEWRTITGRDIQATFSGSVQTAREHAEGLLAAAQRFPTVPLERVVDGPWASAQLPGYARTTGREISFSDAWASVRNRQAYLDALQRDASTGWHPTGTPAGIAQHEFGHVLHQQQLRGIDDRVRSLLRTRAGREVSAYAEQDLEELVAEAFADVMANGAAAASLSREIFALIEAEYRHPGVVAGIGRISQTVPSRTVAQLRAAVRERGITVPAGLAKADLERLVADLERGVPASTARQSAVEAVRAVKATPAKAARKAAAPAVEPYGTVRATRPVDRFGGPAKRIVADGKGGYIGQLRPRDSAVWRDDPSLGTGPTVADILSGPYAGRRWTRVAYRPEPAKAAKKAAPAKKAAAPKPPPAPARMPIPALKSELQPVIDAAPQISRFELAGVPKSTLAHWVERARTLPPGEQPLEVARWQQVVVDKRRALVDALVEADELLANGASHAALTARATARLQSAERALQGWPELAEIRKLTTAMQSGDAAKIRRVIKASGKKLGLRQVGGDAGQTGTFDRKVMSTVAGRPIPDGAHVVVVRPGYELEIGGRRVVLSRPVVMEHEVPKRVPAPPKRQAPAADLARAKKMLSDRYFSANLDIHMDDLRPGFDTADLRWVRQFRQDHPDDLFRLVQDKDIDRRFGVWLRYQRQQIGRRRYSPEQKAKIARLLQGTPAQVRARIEAGLRRQMADASVVIRRRTEASLRDMLERGRMRTQFETGRSGGIYAPDRRAEFERRTWGYADDLAASERVVYGYLAPAGSGLAAEADWPVEQYGSIRIVLKPGVRGRTSFTVGDSLASSEVPSPVASPDWRSFKFDLNVDELDDLFRLEAQQRALYVEAQIHGGVAIDDIAEITFAQRPEQATIDALERAGIPWRVG